MADFGDHDAYWRSADDEAERAQTERLERGEYLEWQAERAERETARLAKRRPTRIRRGDV